MLDQVQSRPVESRTLFVAHAFVLHWTLPAYTCMKPLLRAYDVGMSTGDVESGIWGICFYLEFAIYGGRSLKPIEADYRVYTKQMKEFKQLKALRLSLCFWQSVLNLLGVSERTCELTGEAMDQDKLLKEAEETADTHLSGQIQRIRIFLASFFGEYSLGATLALKFGEQNATENPGSPSVIQARFRCAVCCLAMARATNQRKYLKYGKYLTRVIKGWVEKGNPNVTHYESLLDAQLALVAKRYHVAKKHYETAALLAARNGYNHDQALINELYAEFLYTQMGDRSEAEYRMSEAVKLYDEWGAAAKVKQLRNKYEMRHSPSLPSEIIISGFSDPGPD